MFFVIGVKIFKREHFWKDANQEKQTDGEFVKGSGGIYGF